MVPLVSQELVLVVCARLNTGWLIRCMAKSDHLDDFPDELLRTREHFEALLSAHTSAKSLWDDYGVVIDLKVRLTIRRLPLVVTHCERVGLAVYHALSSSGHLSNASTRPSPSNH